MIDNADSIDETDLFHEWNSQQEKGQPLLLINGAEKWDIALPDLRSRLGAALHLTIDAPDDDMAASLIESIAMQRGLVLGIVTADCGPVLFVDKNAGVVGACHAGWKGALNGVLENTIAAMVELGAASANIEATLGPTISVANYEVSPDFPEPFLQQDKEAARFFSPSTKQDHHMFDLQAYIVWRLTEAGVTADALPVCTYGDAESFFSFRRTTHKNEADYGRQLSAIVCPER